MQVLRTTLRDSTPRQRLGIYLSDHLAGAAAGIDLARRALHNNAGTEAEPVLARLTQQIEEDYETLRRVMAHLGVSPSLAKQFLSKAAERIGRAKLNGQVLGYSPLSRMVELEGLTGAVSMKHSLWTNLATVLPEDALPEDIDLQQLIERAEEQSATLETLRRAAAAEAVGLGDGASRQD